MSSKTKFYEKAVVKADLKRFWIAGLAYGILIFFICFFSYSSYSDEYSYFLSGISQVSNFFGFVFGGFIAFTLFSYLNSASRVAFYHGLPLSRKRIYLSKLISAFLILTVPVLINFVLARLMISGGVLNIKMSELLVWLYSQLLYSYFVFACVALTATVTGNIFSHILITGVCMLLPVLVLSSAADICSSELFGYPGGFPKITGYIYLVPSTDGMYSAKCVVYIIAAAVFLIAAYFIYKKRPLEKSGETNVFAVTKILFIYFAAIIGGTAGYWYFKAFWGESILFLIPFGIIGIIAANMINRKSVTLKGALTHSLIFVCGVLLIFGAFKTDLFGYESRVPDKDKVSYVEVDLGGREYDWFSYSASGKKMLPKNIPDWKIADKEDIEKVRLLHENIVSDRHNTSGEKSIRIRYCLKNGKEITRVYNIDIDATKEFLEPVASLEQVKKKVFSFYKRDDIKIRDFEICAGIQSYTNPILIANGSEGFDELKAALESDIENMKFEDMNFLRPGKSMSPLFIDIRYDEDYVYQNGKAVAEKEVTSYYTDSLQAGYGFEKTIEVLRKHGFSDIEFNSENIIEIAIDEKADDVGELEFTGESGNRKVDKIITDKDEIQKIIDKCFADHIYLERRYMKSADIYLFKHKNGSIDEVYSWDIPGID